MMRRLPPHRDVIPALIRLREAGFRQVTLTNSPMEVVRDQIESAGLSGFFDELISADEVRQLKPEAAPYRLVAERLTVRIEDVCLIAAHAWDVIGARAAGLGAVWIDRLERRWPFPLPEPSRASNLVEAVEQALAE
jgi:2-haloacid dehalogenase